jgi:hypothetical protein
MSLVGVVVIGACDGWAVGARGAAAGPSAQGGTRCSGARSRPTDARAAPRRRLVDGMDLLNVALGALINLADLKPTLTYRNHPARRAQAAPGGRRGPAERGARRAHQPGRARAGAARAARGRAAAQRRPAAAAAVPHAAGARPRPAPARAPWAPARWRGRACGPARLAGPLHASSTGSGRRDGPSATLRLPGLCFSSNVCLDTSSTQRAWRRVRLALTADGTAMNCRYGG